MPMSLVDIFLVYFIINFAFIVVLAYKIMAAEIPKGWRNWTVPVLSMATTMTILLVLGLVYETAGYIGAFVFILLVGKRKEEVGERLFGKISKSPAWSVVYLIGLSLLSFAMVYWKLDSANAGIALGVVYLAYSVLALYSYKTQKSTLSNPDR
ncbi:hypothetical protein E3E26_02400 [Thermococcus sp. LS1]|uniref:hypothetical protein n=1 Tax=Thermococcus sp. LS1 TaxID=1638259 RepID=UPI00143B957D|nr:hypothetical protein [Thermococcus sp. LS1]NJD98649.1 hypothetical protein [Thermococcus sp. LS1]